MCILHSQMTSVRVPIANLVWECLDCHGILRGAPAGDITFVSEHLRTQEFFPMER